MAVKVFTSELLTSSDLNANFQDYTDHRDSATDPHGPNLVVSESVTTPLLDNDTDIIVNTALDASLGLSIPTGTGAPVSSETTARIYYDWNAKKLYVYNVDTDSWDTV